MVNDLKVRYGSRTTGEVVALVQWVAVVVVSQSVSQQMSANVSFDNFNFKKPTTIGYLYYSSYLYKSINKSGVVFEFELTNQISVHSFVYFSTVRQQLSIQRVIKINFSSERFK